MIVTVDKLYPLTTLCLRIKRKRRHGPTAFDLETPLEIEVAPGKAQGDPTDYSLDTAGRLGQASDLTSLLGGAVGEQLVQVLVVALVRAKLLADGLGQNANSGSDLVFGVVLTQEVDDFPVALGQVDFLFDSHVLGDVFVPLRQVDQIAFFVDFDFFTGDIHHGHSNTPLIKSYSQD